MKQVLMYTGDYCPHCKSAKALLESKNVAIKEIDISRDSNKRIEMQERTGGAKTIPQIFIGDHYVGGNEELQALHRQGKLDQLLK